MSKALEIVRVELGPRSYEIEVGTGNLHRAGAIAAAIGQVTRAVVITDENVQKPHAVAVSKSLGEQVRHVDMIVVKPGEATKSVAAANALWQGLVELGADRKTLVVAVGGGVVGDLAGFVAATYARGIRFFQVPTSLLAQVDSSVGGKVGVDLPAAKNMVGAFLQPSAVLIDTATLRTLPEREYLSGFGEVVKYGVILDAELFGQLERKVDALRRRDPALLVSIITRCCRLKADIVEQDEFEQSGRRAVLNYGHTFAHAYETLTGYGALLHGEAVAMGMVAAARLGEKIFGFDRALAQRQRDLLLALGLPLRPPQLPVDEILAVMLRDKKAAHGRLRLVLPRALGHVELVDDIRADDVRAVLVES